MDQSRRPHKTIIATIVAGATLATSGCSIFSRRQADQTPVPDSEAFTSKVSTNENDLPLPVEINQDIGRIAAGGGHFESGGNGKVNVNVNVNFGQGWQQNVPGGPQGSAQNRQPTSVNNGGAGGNSAGSATGSGFGGGSNAPVLPVGDVQRRAGAEKYVVKAGDTLMKISFEKFGNVYRWREILASNQGRIPNSQALVAGTELTIDGTDYVVVERNGTPYLIVRNDTLGKISSNVYGTASFWRDLWKNNPQLIHNPNRIYSGFTLYYRDKADLGAPVNIGKNATTESPRFPASKKKKNGKKPAKKKTAATSAVTPTGDSPATDVSGPAAAASTSSSAPMPASVAAVAGQSQQWQKNTPPALTGAPPAPASAAASAPSVSEKLEQPTAEAFPAPVVESATK